MVDAVFIDRDGTINVERSDYVKTVAEFQLLPGALTALSELSRLSVPVIVITNQSAIGRGIVTSPAINAIHAHLAMLVSNVCGRLDAFYVCPHHPEARCNCRKPRPGLLQRAAADFGVDLTRCVFIGDSVTDLGAAKAAGCTPLMVRTGNQAQQLADLAKVDSSMLLMDDLADAVRWLCAQPAASWPLPSAAQVL